jgi:hypothetical protein
LLIGLILFYRTILDITIQWRKANLGKRRAEPFSAYPVLNDPSPAYLSIFSKEKGRARAQRGLSFVQKYIP